MKIKFNWKIKVIIFVVILSILAFSIFYPTFKSHSSLKLRFNTLSVAEENLRKIIEYQDKNYQVNETFIPLDSTDNLIESLQNFEVCMNNCLACDYSTNVAKNSFTVTAKCPIKDKELYYLGYVRVPFGKHSGVDGYYNKCKSKGVYAGTRYLVNTIGPCFKQKNGIKSIASGRKKILVVETYPPNSNISFDGKLIGNTSSFHQTVNQNYGRFYWGEAFDGNLTISKKGYETVEFPINWESFTYHATVILKPSEIQHQKIGHP